MTKPLIDTTLPIIDGLGRKVVIVHTLANPEALHPLVGVVTDEDGMEFTDTYTLTGAQYDGLESSDDIRNVRPSKWLNVYDPTNSHGHGSRWCERREEADMLAVAPGGRIAIIERQDNGTPAGKTIFHDLTVQA